MPFERSDGHRRADRLPLTVIGGYLGAGKTTVLNRLLAEPGGRRIGVIVNDFGSVGIDADVLARAGNDGVVNLPNGCACCTLGDDLHGALERLAAARGIDHVVVEVSGVADPAAVAAWSTVEPFEPGGVIVLAAADSIRDLATDRYVGGEVRRQLVGADLIVVTKVDRCNATTVGAVETWLDGIAPAIPRVSATQGDVPSDVLLGVAPSTRGERGAPVAREHMDAYEAWEWTTDRPLDRGRLEPFLDALPHGVLRVKGWVLLADGDIVDVHVVGRTREITARPTEQRRSVRSGPGPERTGRTAGSTALVAIGVRGTPDPFASGSIAPPASG